LPEAIEVCGVQPEFHFLNGLRYLEKSKLAVYFFPVGIKFFKAALKLKPDFKDALFNLACISYNYKDFKNASEYFRRILEIELENAEVRSYLDCCLKKLDETVDKELISEECPKTLNLSKDFIDKPDMEYKHKFSDDVSFILECINHLGLEFVRNGKFEEGLKRFRNGLKIYPESPGLHFNMAIVYSWLNNFEEAEKHALLALRLRDFFGRIPDYRKREILEKEKEIRYKPPKVRISEWTFERALKEGNYFLDAYNSLGTIYYKKREFHNSILAFKKVIEIYNKDAMGHYNLGCAYWEINDWKNAEKEWKDAIKYEEELKREKKRGKIPESQLDVSLIVFKRVVSFRAHKCLGRLYLGKNLPEKALKEFEKAIDLEPGDPEPYYELGKMYESKSELDEKYLRKAISYYEKYLYLGGEKEKEVKEILKSIK
jgi:tetratricopeptide (TPR) repeat protein